MNRFFCTVSPELAADLEEHFCEELSSWGLQQNRKEDPWIFSGYFEEVSEAEEAWQALREIFPVLPESPEREELADRDWQEAYKAFLQPWSCGPLHWIPRWQKEEYTVPEGAYPFYFDAGMAFGTGSHETTRLCARRLLEATESWGGGHSGRTVIDAGCGSGILAISAKMLGYESVYGFDRDPEAVRVSEENLEANGMAGSIEFAQCGIEEGLRGRSADLLMANIQADVLQIYADEIVAALKSGGWLILSGILVREINEVRQTFEAIVSQNGLQAFSDSRVDGEWADLVIRF